MRRQWSTTAARTGALGAAEQTVRGHDAQGRTSDRAHSHLFLHHGASTRRTRTAVRSAENCGRARARWRTSPSSSASRAPAAPTRRSASRILSRHGGEPRPRRQHGAHLGGARREHGGGARAAAPRRRRVEGDARQGEPAALLGGRRRPPGGRRPAARRRRVAVAGERERRLGADVGVPQRRRRERRGPAARGAGADPRAERDGG